VDYIAWRKNQDDFSAAMILFFNVLQHTTGYNEFVVCNI